MKRVAVIPARFQSSRFPGKSLVPLMGRPMILHVADRVSQAFGLGNTYVATDSMEIERVVEEAGYQVIMTSEAPLTGTDRVWEAAQQVDAGIYLNVQGDEPLVDPKDIERIAGEKEKRPDYVINGMCPLGPTEDPASVHIPKVITTEGNVLVYMSRLPVPGFKSRAQRPNRYMKQVCIYAFSPSDLEAFGTFGRKSWLEEREDIEILRFFELGRPVFMVETRGSSLAVDTPEDVPKVEEALRRLGGGP
jgi:3-deoxy-manno-octulosonate cytidylyltransferase (CMP-KDO synthetase)